MTIMHVTKKYPRALGGDAIVVSQLKKQQEQAGHRVVIVTSNCPDIVGGSSVYKVGLKDTAAGLDAITPRRVFSLLILLVRMFRIIAREKPDIIHTHSIDMAFAASLAARFYKVSRMHTFHIVTFYDHTQSPLRRKTELWFAKKARLSCATAPNEYDVQKLRSAGLTNVALLANGVDIDFWQGNTKPVDTPFQFLAVGRHEPQKGYDTLLAAVAKLRQQTQKPFGVVLVGKGSQTHHLQQLAANLGIADIVTFAGRQSPETTRKLLHDSQAVVLPSLYETTPITLLEAWAAGRPVIATPVGILRNLPEQFMAAKLIAKQDAQELTEAMHLVLNDTILRQQLAVSGQQEVQKYTWPKIAAHLESLYGEIL